MMVALGRTPEEEFQPDLHKLGLQLTGGCGLFITSMPSDDVIKFVP